MGIIGYSNAKEELEKVSEHKEGVDDMKAKKLEELS